MRDTGPGRCLDFALNGPSGRGRQWVDFDAPINLELNTEGESPEKVRPGKGRSRRFGHNDIVGLLIEKHVAVVQVGAGDASVRQHHLFVPSSGQTEGLDLRWRNGETAIEAGIDDRLERTGPLRADNLQSQSGLLVGGDEAGGHLPRSSRSPPPK